MTTLSALAQITADLRAYHENEIYGRDCAGPKHCPLAKAISDLGEVMDGIAKEIGGNSDAKRLDWWQLAILREQCDPEQQFIKINEGPMIGEMTLVIYDGRQCTNYRATTIREVLDLAMCATDHLEAPAAPRPAPEEASTVRSPAEESTIRPSEPGQYEFKGILHSHSEFLDPVEFNDFCRAEVFMNSETNRLNARVSKNTYDYSARISLFCGVWRTSATGKDHA